MSFRTDLLKNVVGPLMKLPSPTSEGGIFDVYPYTVVVRTAVWSSGEVGTGAATTSDYTILPRPSVKEDDDTNLVVRNIVPPHPKGGNALSSLNPTTVAGTEFYYVVTGANGTHYYQLVDIDTSNPFFWNLKLKTLTRTTPF